MQKKFVPGVQKIRTSTEPKISTLTERRSGKILLNTKQSTTKVACTDYCLQFVWPATTAHISTSIPTTSSSPAGYIHKRHRTCPVEESEMLEPTRLSSTNGNLIKLEGRKYGGSRSLETRYRPPFITGICLDHGLAYRTPFLPTGFWAIGFSLYRTQLGI